MYGNYRLSACSNSFLSCSNGLSYLMDCPADLLYNAVLDQCDWPHNIIGCEDASGEELKDISGSGIEASGDFSGLTFELGIESSGAVREIIVDASGNMVSIIDASGDLEESGSGSGLGSGEEMSFEVLVFTLVDCRLLSDGFYPLTACEAKYVSCHAGLPSVLHCFPGQFYSAAHQICEEPHKIGCTDDGDFSGSGDLIFSGEFSGFSGEFSGFSGEESGFGSGEFSGEFSGMSGDGLFFSTSDCSSLPNGNYPMGACSAQFLSCSNNLAFIMDCPSSLFYNWAIDACDWPANLGCDFETSGLDGSGSGDEQPSCTENNGSFPVGPCLPVFMKCVDGIRFEMSCESGQLFSEKDSVCLPTAQLNCTAST
ncbi:hypothetical protein WR25_26212 isoform B [Diploscapter pachys]|uniref:Chitin-binding type-2 domain-containing protein n=1 Tax=Diploscapter pachys TaxID=2018661 RepID=A0A2A2LLX5_9BILA|nr:hypothetical protein WR25_26212 isoform A [Diploscapter pachys]PAV87227.1 hypothetical protein WR25_26212 isoform B [Diploscapter pachys]